MLSVKLIDPLQCGPLQRRALFPIYFYPKKGYKLFFSPFLIHFFYSEKSRCQCVCVCVRLKMYGKKRSFPRFSERRESEGRKYNAVSSAIWGEILRINREQKLGVVFILEEIFVLKCGGITHPPPLCLNILPQRWFETYQRGTREGSLPSIQEARPQDHDGLACRLLQLHLNRGKFLVDDLDHPFDFFRRNGSGTRLLTEEVHYVCRELVTCLGKRRIFGLCYVTLSREEDLRSVHAMVLQQCWWLQLICVERENLFNKVHIVRFCNMHPRS